MYSTYVHVCRAARTHHGATRDTVCIDLYNLQGRGGERKGGEGEEGRGRERKGGEGRGEEGRRGERKGGEGEERERRGKLGDQNDN